MTHIPPLVVHLSQGQPSCSRPTPFIKISCRRLRHAKNLTPSASPPTKSHAVDFATHKISHHLPENLTPSTSPPTKSHRSPSPPWKSCFFFLWCPFCALVTGIGYGTMGRRKVDMNVFCFCLFLFFCMCKCVQQFLFLYIIFFIK